MEDPAEDMPPSEEAEQQEAEVEDPQVDQQEEAPEGDRDVEEKDAREPENAEDRDDNDKGAGAGATAEINDVIVAATVDADQTPAPEHKVVRLTNMATAEEISDPEWYEEIKVDIEEESKKYGNVKTIVIPRNGEQPEKSESYGVGLVFVEFEKTEEADAAIAKMHGRTFDGRTVIAELFPYEAFEAKTWDAEAASKPTVPGVAPGGLPGMPGIPNISALMQSGLSGLAGGGMGGMLGMGAMGAMGGAKLGFAAGGPGNQDVRPGDWACPMCNNNCFARTMMCNRKYYWDFLFLA
eukprot:gene4164-5143_t